MNNATINLKITERLNKLSSSDYANIQCWQIVEAFNKGMTDWFRRNAHGNNLYKEGIDQSTRRIDDLQKILKDTPSLPVVDKGNYFESIATDWPQDFLEYSRFSCTAATDCCDEKQITVYLAEESNVDLYLNDNNRRPSFDWGETFAVIKGDKIQVYHDKQFEVKDLKLVYYRQPVKIQITGCKDPYTNTIPTVDIECEFKDDLCELFITEAVKILSGDTENGFQYQRSTKESEENN